MAYKVSITPLTFLEIDEAIFWYEKQLPKLGQRFLIELNKRINKIQEKPENYLLIYPPVRRTILKKFPYKLYYIVKDKSEIVIIALLHVKRSNRYISQRIKQ